MNNQTSPIEFSGTPLVTCLFKGTIWSFTESQESDVFLFSRPGKTPNFFQQMLGAQLFPV